MNSDNPYVQSPDRIEEPPTTFVGAIKNLGPGFIISASIVGSGELIATTGFGAEAGFVGFWVIIVSCLVKVAVQLEFGKHAIYTGETPMAALNALPGPKLGKAHWTIWTWLLLMLPKQLQLAGILAGVAQVMVIIVPLFDAVPAAAESLFKEPAALNQFVWAVPLAILVALLVFRGYYRLLEKMSIVMIALFSLLTILCVVLLQRTDYAISWDNIASGLTFQLPAYAVFAALGAFGITGVGGDEIMMYNYWLLEKGYAAKTGPRDDSQAWTRRAKGWIRVMYLDAFVSMVVYTVVTAAFYLLGCAILHGAAEKPEGYDMVNALSAMYTKTLGPWAMGIFLAGAFVVLFSTLFSALAGWSRIFSDAFSRIGLFKFENQRSRAMSIAVLAWCFPLLWTLLSAFTNTPVLNVVIGGISTCFILLLVLGATLYFRYVRLPTQLKPSRVYDVALWISSVAIVTVGIYALPKAYDDFRKKTSGDNQPAAQAEEQPGNADGEPASQP